MVCAPCQKKAEARRQAMLQQVAQTNPKAARAYNANTTAAAPKTKVLPRYEWPVPTPITDTEFKPTTVWNEGYHAFMMRKDK